MSISIERAFINAIINKESSKKELEHKNTYHQFAPLDNPMIIKKFLKNWQPKIAIFVESEIWPNLITQTSKECKLILLNCRISKNSYKIWRIFKNLESRCGNSMQKRFCN